MLFKPKETRMQRIHSLWVIHMKPNYNSSTVTDIKSVKGYMRHGLRGCTRELSRLYLPWTVHSIAHYKSQKTVWAEHLKLSNVPFYKIWADALKKKNQLATMNQRWNILFIILLLLSILYWDLYCISPKKTMFYFLVSGEEVCTPRVAPVFLHPKTDRRMSFSV